MAILVLFSFLGGIITVLSPCILPLLPIVLSAATSDGKKRPYGVILGFIMSFTVITLSVSAIVRRFNLPPDILRPIAASVILLLGLILIVPKLQVWYEGAISRITTKGAASAGGSGFSGGVVTGLSLGIIWAPCVGPIMAAVITLAITETVSINAVLITVFYSIGTAIPLFAIMQGGKRLLDRVPWLKQKSGQIQRAFAGLMLVTAIGIFFNLDRRFQGWVLDAFPGYGSALTILEENQLIDEKLEVLSDN